MEPEQHGVFGEIDAALVPQRQIAKQFTLYKETRVIDSDFPRKPNHFG